MIGCLVFDRLANCPLESSSVVRDEVGQVTVLGMAPLRFDRFEFLSIGREPFELDVPQPRRQDGIDCRTM